MGDKVEQSEKEDEHEGRKEEEEERESVGMNPPSMVDSEVNDTITQELQENDNPIWAADSTPEEQPATTESIEAGEEQESEESKQPESENNEYEYNDDQESAETKQNMKEENEANEANHFCSSDQKATELPFSNRQWTLHAAASASSSTAAANFNDSQNS